MRRVCTLQQSVYVGTRMRVFPAVIFWLLRMEFREMKLGGTAEVILLLSYQNLIGRSLFVVWNALVFRKARYQFGGSSKYYTFVTN